jgi:glycosyltransferase involved in cell wall biosynthesis
VKLLVFTTLFPRPSAPHHGIFVLERLRAWLAAGSAASPRDATVIAPVPQAPPGFARGRWASFGDVPAEERIAAGRDGAAIRVLHPRYVVIPKVGMSVAPLLLARAGRRCARELAAQGERFDLVDAHYLYPDAVAAAAVARDLSLPLVVTARGTDLNLIPRHAIPRRWLRGLLARADGAIAVSESLRAEMAKLAPPALRTVTLRNGVDLAKFRPLPRDEARRALGWPLDRRILLSVGHLVERKGHHHLIAALPRLPADVIVKIVGDGEERARLLDAAARLGVAERVDLVGPLPHERLHVAYSAADVLVLLSAREGWPNVLLESLACGTTVLATRAGGIPEVVRDPEIGTLVGATDEATVAAAVGELLSQPRERARMRGYAEEHSWARTVDGMQTLFEEVLLARRGTRE